MVKIRTATYAPRFLVGANSEVTASAVSSLMPAAAPAIVVPAICVSWSSLTSSDRDNYLPMNMFIDFAQVAMTLPRTSNAAPSKAT
jgi:hypothetical protein